MVQWTTFYENGACSAEILVGIHDRWISQLPYGPTQAERVLHHTAMMDLAHERRFVVCESRHPLPDFETEHLQRLEYYLNRLQTHFDDNRVHRPDDSTVGDDHALIGLVPFPKDHEFLKVFPFVGTTGDADLGSMNKALNDILEQSKAATKLLCPFPAEHIIVDENESYSEQMKLRLMEELPGLKAKSRAHMAKKPRLLKDVRIRKEPIHCNKDTTTAKGQSKRTVADECNV